MIDLKLKEIRNQLGMKQSDIASELGITREAYSMYENGKRQMGYDALDSLATFFNVSIDDLLGRKTDFIALNDAEKELIEKFRRLDNRGMQSVNASLEQEIQYISKISGKSKTKK